MVAHVGFFIFSLGSFSCNGSQRSGNATVAAANGSRGWSYSDVERKKGGWRGKELNQEGI